MDLKPERVGDQIAWLTTHRYAILLGALALRLVTVPVVEVVVESRCVPAIVSARATQWALLIFACILAVGRGRAFVTLTLASLAGITLEGIDALWRGAWVAAVGEAIFACAIVGWAVAHLLRRTFAARVVQTSNLHAAAAIYLLIGFAFANAYQLVQLFQPGAFHFPEDTAVRDDVFLYFSFITLATVGYGDVTPVGGFARMLAVIEALAGQIYLVVSVSRLVGLYVAQRTERVRE